MGDPVLLDLAREVRAVACASAHEERRRLWTDLHSLRSPRALVHYAMYESVWEREIAPSGLIRHSEGLARAVEVQLRARLWKAAHIPDDEPVHPTVWLGTPRPPGDDRLWGVALPSRHTEGPGSYKPMPVVTDERDLSRLRPPVYAEDDVAKRDLLARVCDLLDGELPIKLHSDEVHFGPFEWAVRMRGMDALLYDVVDRPRFVHSLMDVITSAMVGYHLAREAAGAVDAEASWGYHTVFDDTPGSGQRLNDCWVYCHAQSSASFSPAMYAEFVHPYNARVASLFRRVYYHGCEDLSRKVASIRSLPGLRLFHVGPWTPLAPIVASLQGVCALEVHSHPGEVLRSWSQSETRADIERLHAAASRMPHVLKLCDVETVFGAPERLRIWAEQAQETVQ